MESVASTKMEKTLDSRLSQLIRAANKGDYQYFQYSVQVSPLKSIVFHKFVNAKEIILIESENYLGEQPIINYYEQTRPGL